MEEDIAEYTLQLDKQKRIEDDLQKDCSQLKEK
jgi:hypothetical protein